MVNPPAIEIQVFENSFNINWYGHDALLYGYMKLHLDIRYTKTNDFPHSKRLEQKPAVVIKGFPGREKCINRIIHKMSSIHGAYLESKHTSKFNNNPYIVGCPQ